MKILLTGPKNSKLHKALSKSIQHQANFEPLLPSCGAVRAEVTLKKFHKLIQYVCLGGVFDHE